MGKGTTAAAQYAAQRAQERIEAEAAAKAIREESEIRAEVYRLKELVIYPPAGTPSAKYFQAWAKRFCESIEYIEQHGRGDRLKATLAAWKDPHEAVKELFEIPMGAGATKAAAEWFKCMFAGRSDCLPLDVERALGFVYIYVAEDRDVPAPPTPPKKTRAKVVHVDRKKIFPKGEPENRDFLEYCNFIANNCEAGPLRIEDARKYTTEETDNCPRAAKLIDLARKWQARGKLNL